MIATSTRRHQIRRRSNRPETTGEEKGSVPFYRDSAIIQQDVRKSYPEVRYVAVGFLDARLHVLCFTPIEDGIRVISFRKANTREVKDYEKTHPTY